MQNERKYSTKSTEMLYLSDRDFFEDSSPSLSLVKESQSGRYGVEGRMRRSIAMRH
jgi:hypothetical protein